MRDTPDWNQRTMPAVAQTAASSASTSGPSLRIWTPDSGTDQSVSINQKHPPSTHRIKNPVRDKTRKKCPAQGQKELWESSPIDPDVAAEAARLADQFKAPTISEQQRLWMRANMTLRQFYCDWVEPERRKLLAAGKLSRETLAKDRQTINRWELVTRPEKWPDGRDWPGVPVGLITLPLVENFRDRMEASGYPPGTIIPTLCHLGTILHAGGRLGLVDPLKIPEVTVVKKNARYYSDEESVAAYQSLAGYPDLQTAFVLSLATGARPRDLFAWRVSDLRLDSCPVVRFVIHKTKMFIVVPLCPVAVAHLRRLDLTSEYLFPRLGNPACKDPERSEPSRARNDQIKRLLFAAGVLDIVDGQQIEIKNPWQIGRRTAANWVEQAGMGRGMSSLLLGHSGGDDKKPKKVTRVHYLAEEMEPLPALVAAVNAVKWPEVFKAI